MLGDNKFVIADADILVSTLLEKDANNKDALELQEKIVTAEIGVKFPNTAILEAITMLRRVFNRADYANKINNQFLNGEYDVIYVTEKIQKLASEIFSKTKSKQNTIFDCVVLATAKLTKAEGIFSFDDWYKKMGVKSLKDLV